ncbi:MAG: hypothetical protein J5676_04820 [Bacteroidaceae bacterium]|nr:hypothetical protein [Bacteroidaceae bacterium]
MKKLENLVLFTFVLCASSVSAHHNESPYSYCANNPVNRIDPDGRDYYRNDQGAVFWREGSANFVNVDGVRYRNIGETYSVYQFGQRLDYNQDNLVKVSYADPKYNLDGGQYIPHSFVTDDGTKVSVTFLYVSQKNGGNGDKALSSDAVSLFIDGVNEANKDGAGITSIDVSTTTTGKHWSDNSAHKVENGATAIDIDIINNVPIKKESCRQKTNQLQIGFEKTGMTYQNIGPEIQTGVKKRLGGHDNHIHIDALPY